MKELLVGSFCTTHSICLNIGFRRAALYRNVAFSNLVPSTKKKDSRFLKQVFVFKQICFKVKVLKTFKISSGCSIKTSKSLKRRAVLKTSSTVLISFYFPLHI